ncbi:MAG: hypothetical protein Q9183_005885 [Haloplaca sp. 2 TL-2023]
MPNQGSWEIRELAKDIERKEYANRQNPTASSRQAFYDAQARLKRAKTARDNRSTHERSLRNIRSTVSREALPPRASSQPPSKRELQVAKARDDDNEARAEVENCRSAVVEIQRSLNAATSFSYASRRQISLLEQDYRDAQLARDRSERAAEETQSRLNKLLKYLHDGRINAQRWRHEADDQAAADQAAADQAATDQAATDQAAADQAVLKAEAAATDKTPEGVPRR